MEVDDFTIDEIVNNIGEDIENIHDFERGILYVRVCLCLIVAADTTSDTSILFNIHLRKITRSIMYVVRLLSNNILINTQSILELMKSEIVDKDLLVNNDKIALNKNIVSLVREFMTSTSKPGKNKLRKNYSRSRYSSVHVRS